MVFLILFLFIGVEENAILAQMKENSGISSLPHVKQLIIGWKLTSFDVMIEFKLDLACICMYKSTDCLMRFSKIDRNRRLLWVCKLDNILKIFHFEIISENEGNLFLHWNRCTYKCRKVCNTFAPRALFFKYRETTAQVLCHKSRNLIGDRNFIM